MKNDSTLRTGGRVLVDALRIHGVERIFCVPGESFLAALDALHEVRGSMQLVVCRHEGGAAYMAAAHGRFTGMPGICFVTRGPGAANALVGMHVAAQDSIPMVLLIGQVARGQLDREAFQEIDFRRLFAGVAKWVVQIDDARRIPELLSQAFHRAVNGRPGPVAVALPEDMLAEEVSVPDVPSFKRIAPAPKGFDAEELRNLLAESERPIAIVGGGGWTKRAVELFEQFSKRTGLPVAASFRCQDYFDNGHSNYIGDLGLAAHPGLNRRIETADLLLVVGARLGEMASGGYTLVNVPLPRQKFVHVHLGIEELGRVYCPSLAINSGMEEFVEQLATLDMPQRWRSWKDEARADYVASLTPSSSQADLNLAEIVTWLRDRLPADAVITNGAGNYTGWIHRFYQFRAFGTQLAPKNGSMGFGVPAAIAAKLAAPSRIVVAFAGDGCFMMNGQELATAVQHRANILVVVINNGMLGTIRMHQERNYPGRVIGTDIVNPDFAALAKAYGMHSEIVTRTAEFEGAFERALASELPALLELRVDPETITSRSTISQIRKRGRERMHAT